MIDIENERPEFIVRDLIQTYFEFQSLNDCHAMHPTSECTCFFQKSAQPFKKLFDFKPKRRPKAITHIVLRTLVFGSVWADKSVKLNYQSHGGV